MRCSVIKIVLGVIGIILTCSALVTSQSTFPISPRLDSLRLYVASQLNLKEGGTQGIPLAKIDRAISRGYSQVCIDYPAIEALDTVTLKRDNEGVSLAANFLRLSAAYKLVDSTVRIPMTIVNVSDLSAQFPTFEENKDKRGETISPRSCYTYNGRFFTHPKDRSGAVSTDSTLYLIQYYAMGQPLLSADSTVDVLPEYVEKVIQYACFVLSITQQDFAAAQFYFQHYQSGLGPRKPREAELKQ